MTSQACVFYLVNLFLSLILFYSGETYSNGTFQWIPRGWEGLPLYCPIDCKDPEFAGPSIETCCACHSKSILDYNNNFSHLNISTNGYLEGNTSANNIALEYPYRYLKVFPKNICDFPGITKINFSYNLILEIPHLTCLPNLTHLDLSWNLITVLPQISLTENRNLRFVNLSHNAISYTDTGALAFMAFHSLNLNGNLLTSVDITDFVFERPFCKIDLSNNSLTMATNKFNWNMTLNKTYGPGHVDFSHNQVKEFPDVRKLGFTNILDLGKLYHFGFDFRFNPLICDCRIAKPVMYFKSYIQIMSRDYFSITCGSPDSFRGKTIPGIIKNGQIKDLICNYTSISVCPPGCSCIERPKIRRLSKKEMTISLQMKCTGARLKRLPHILPESEEIEFFLRRNPIQEITNEHYLKRVTVLDLPFIPSFEMEALEKFTLLQEFSIPRTQQVHGIPRLLSFLDPCVFLQQGNFVMNCTCSHYWMYDWIRTKEANNCSSHSFYCFEGGKENLLTTYLSRLDCKIPGQEPNYILLLSGSSAFVFAFIIVIFVHIYKFELKVILRSRRLITSSKKTLDEDCVVYISYDEKIKDLNLWLKERIEPFLRRNELSAFIPTRDLPPGCIRCEETARQISVSRYYIVFLSDDYLHEDSLQTGNEWKCIWNSYLSDCRKELVIINYDMMNMADVPCKKIRAFMRFGDVVDFASGEKKIFCKILDKFLTNH
ncbi:uncharacterized protein LOC134253902 [Saccostrea cucullata]|uniref:uncharacterized protein LOC134253902 n=1 Tax=Saccostrea cuccullata TaxID=36930 RepID=UPI002ED2ADDB